jgi:uncharacterized OB-fold protein
MSDRLPGLPGPQPDPTTEGYWTSAGDGRLVIQRCDGCGVHRHPPTEVCYSCGSLEWSWDPHPGLGSVYSYTWTDRPIVPALASLGVYNVSVVELDDTTGVVRILTQVTDVPREELSVGLPVEVHFDPAGDGVALPMFRPRSKGGRP